MVTNLRNKIINPISVSLIIILIGILTALALNGTYGVTELAETRYFKSASFMESLADLTVYLKQTRLENKPLSASKYESLDNLTYYIKSGDKEFTNDINHIGINELSQASKFQLMIKFGERSNFTVQSSNWDEGNSDEVFKEELSYIIRRGSLGRENKSLGYENIEVYYFIENGCINTTTDYIGRGLERYEKSVILQITLLVQLILMIGFVLYIILAQYKNKLQGKVWYVLEKVNSELKVIGLLVILKVIIGIYNKVKFCYSLIETDLMQKYTGISIYIIGSALIAIAVAWYTVDIIALYREGGLERFKKNSFLIKNQQVIKKSTNRICGCIYTVIGINPQQPSYLKLIFLNMVHILALIFFAEVAYNRGLGDALLVIILYVVIAMIGGLIYAWDFKRMCHVIKMRKSECKISFSYSKMTFGLMIYAVMLVILRMVADTDESIGISAACILGVIGIALSFIYVRRYQEFYEYIIGMRDNIQYTKPAKSFLSPIIEELENMNIDFQNAVKQEVISQRMKTELIANVSHDLKTPLTSIISYIDLLKDENLSKETQQEYIAILDQKSQRLKILIEDLFEASKAASGNMELITEEIDVVALMKQTLGELAEKINRSNLQFKINMPEEKVICKLDGRRTYRIFENLIGNALKYSAPYSRVYIDIETGEEVSITFKNMSAYEMNFTAEEITERFKRGDESRHTEGSGLGLSIAKSLTELQDGKLDIVIDGDLFKVIVKFKSII